MRILFASVYPHLPDVIGGLQTTTDNLCVALRDAGAEAAVLCGLAEHRHEMASSTARRDESLGYTVIRAADPVEALPLVAAAWDPSVIVVQSGPTLLPMIAASLRSERPTAVYLHNVEDHQLGGFLMPDPKLCYLANSGFSASRWQALSGIQSVVIPPLVLPDRYFVEALGDHVLYVNPVPIKGVEIMFAMARVCPDIPFLVAESWGLNPHWREYCLRRVQTHKNIEWVGPMQDTRALYRRSRTLLMPSIWEEAYGRTAVEAQISGIPVVASQRGALPETVGPGGVLVDPHASSAAWAEALRRAYMPGPEYDALSRAAREHAYQTAAAPLVVGRLLTRLAEHANR